MVRRAQLDLTVKALAPLWGFRQRGGRGLSPWVKGETEAPPAQAPEVGNPQDTGTWAGLGRSQSLLPAEASRDWFPP